MAEYKYPALLQIKPNPPEGDLHLKPCPFCGKEDPIYWEYETAAGPRWKVFCLGDKCGGCVDTGYSQQRHQVTEKWNRRAENE